MPLRIQSAVHSSERTKDALAS
ncbi:hypothetical protein AGR7C_Cc260530 [Agrobacterium deltaense Zutra 3/1]|uniref:Uncharacterized protein n=1 Tax=Agrobacterium deltaense Zutra 3/1 TaxID=1183427 RepID=A0A1S7QE42_9HYPH|nr:hypothetical protein AGR7C_Cc260530 [Agrobacterium deltaense Zutra 3/1]